MGKRTSKRLCGVYLSNPPIFRGFSINFSPTVTVLGDFSCLSARRGAWWLIRIVGRTLDPYLLIPQQCRSLPACRVPAHSDIHRVKAPLSRRGTTGATYVCSKGGARLIWPPMNSSQGFIHSTYPQCGELTRLLLGNLAHIRIRPLCLRTRPLIRANTQK